MNAILPFLLLGGRFAFKKPQSKREKVRCGGKDEEVGGGEGTLMSKPYIREKGTCIGWFGSLGRG